MSARLATILHTKPRAAALVALAALSGIVCGLAGSGGTATAQPKQPTKIEDIGKNANKLDRNNPLPADAHRKTHPDFTIPGLDRLMFARVKDYEAVASEEQNALEYAAWVEVVMHAKKFATADLEQHGARDLTVYDLFKPIRSAFRYDLVRFDGKLICVRRLPAPLIFQNNPELGVAELYEARFVPLNESPLTPVSIVFTELPEALAGVRQKQPKEWLDVDHWIAASGYFFKMMSVSEPGDAVSLPVLVGKSVTPLPGPPVATGENPAALDKNLRIYRYIRDKARVASRPKLTDPDAPWEEAAAYDRLVRHANRFKADVLEQHARTDLKFADVFEDDSQSGYRLDLVKFEGRLISLRRFDPGQEMKSSGVEYLYEGWLVPANEPRGNPVCIIFSEPVEGIEANGRVNQWVSFAGFLFKKMRYESAEPDAKDPYKGVQKFAPLLIGKRPVLRRDPDVADVVTLDVATQAAILGGAVLLGGAGVMTWFYRRGGRKPTEAIDLSRNRNPFDAVNNPPPA